MKQPKPSRELARTRRRYFFSMMITCIIIFAIGVLIITAFDVLFGLNPWLRLALYILNFIAADIITRKMGNTGFLRRFIDAIHR
ncbi:MAG: hypothetical protein LKE61_03290 [Erysipelotrichaceae bacterium]|jgi:F0F1-type ATP synthase assembly protein I|uniref:Uncharacterized protein n=1 Tax=Grylomicrobium aquisgranensis TaxID=2926318 RepID=A0AB35U3K7_9FIRM|nr:hypothetical protein [Lactimicrobium massiliense]MCH4019879.1 hypothetical protein [Erysipelotrichaceae bacterium]MCI1326435.1 hypothetical protein [Solobacterium sp.]MDX8420103.1 hypothetical protein [Stecheria sp. CLA-KB-P133]MCH4045127.1 hypothetical protein [Erysipelotrichaceae bacterium]MCH4122338.1 hypothetical protein [Erysipelotrichaceae bacterium]